MLCGEHVGDAGKSIPSTHTRVPQNYGLGGPDTVHYPDILKPLKGGPGLPVARKYRLESLGARATRFTLYLQEVLDDVPVVHDRRLHESGDVVLVFGVNPCPSLQQNLNDVLLVVCIK